MCVLFESGYDSCLELSSKSPTIKYEKLSRNATTMLKIIEIYILRRRVQKFYRLLSHTEVVHLVMKFFKVVAHKISVETTKCNEIEMIYLDHQLVTRKKEENLSLVFSII